uniref:Uncharacterized protein n=1 Tax=Tanacetum cinerariifolium TaxID=118510 RepID=A0A6L2LBX3_TANCI|nr:hypothetical protein [Tanacetum cinerariifolium]
MFGAMVYYTWQERNNRLFKGGKIDETTLIKTIKETVQLKIASFVVKESRAVREVEDRWNLQIQRKKNIIQGLVPSFCDSSTLVGVCSGLSVAAIGKVRFVGSEDVDSVRGAGSQTSLLSTGREYWSTRITLSSGRKIHPNFCITKRMSAMANATLLVTTVTKPATNPRYADATPRVNIQEFCEEYYEDILPIIMDKVRRDRRKDVHTRIDFEEGPWERTREDSHHSSARARTTKPEWLKVQDRLRYGDRHVLDRLSHRRQSAFDRLSETYSPRTTKYRPWGTDSKDHPRGRSRPHSLDTSKEDRPNDKERFHRFKESYDDSFSHSYRDVNRSRHMKRRRDNESPLFSVSRSESSDGRIQMPNNYDGIGDPEVHVKIFQAAAQMEIWAMPTWCHMFSSTLIGAARVWFDELPSESIDSYKDLKAMFLAYCMQQKKYVKDSMKIHNIKQKDGETIEDFMKRFKVETGRMKRAPECMRISRFMHGVNNPELTKCLNEHVPKTLEEIMITTTAFIRGEAAAANKKKGHTSWKAQDQSKRQNSDKRSDFQGKKETTAKDKPTAIYMIQSWQRTTRQKVTQNFERVKEITFPPLVASSGTEGPLVIEAEIGGHMIHRMYVNGGSSMEILYEHCINRLRPETKSQIIPATTSLTGFSGETIWPLGQLRLLVIIGDANHSTRAWMNFMIVRSLSPYNGIIGRPGIRVIQAVPSTVHGMLKFPRSEERYRIKDAQLGHICMATVRHNRSATVSSETPAQHPGRILTCKGEAPERAKAIQADVQKLVEARIMREVYYHGWLSNPVMCFLDAYKGYHQIQLAEPDEEKTTFHTGQGVYCYTKMPFGLKNAGATYHRLIDKAFESQIGQNIKVYVDELVVKSYIEAEMMRDIEETFRTLPKRLWWYFQTHPTTVITDQPVKQIMSRPDVARRLQKWSIMLEEHNITYMPRTGQRTDLSRFSHRDAGRKPTSRADGRKLTKSRGHFSRTAHHITTSNNEAKYEALIAGLRIAARMGVKNAQVSVDSKLVANQVLGTYVAKEDNIVKYLDKVKSLVSGFTNFSISQVPRSKNKKADALSKITSTSFAHLSKQVLVEVLKDKSINEKEVATVVEEDRPTWMTPILEYLKEGTLPGDKKEARKLRLKARQYKLIEGILYRRMHAGPRSVVAKAIRLGYYWPTMHRDARDMIRKCNDGKVKFLIVAMDYFTKWIKAKAVATITGGHVKKFVWDNIVFLFGLPVKHPHSNGLVETVNRSLREGIKARLGEGNKNWAEELPYVLWAHRTMIKLSHGDTPFSLTYGTEAIIPTEIGMPTYLLRSQIHLIGWSWMIKEHLMIHD